MENASKALVIAGAILATLMIIGLGVVIITNVTGVFQRANVDQQAAQANNSQYENLMGDNVSSASVKQLITLVRTKNITATQNGEDMVKIAFFDVTQTNSSGALVGPQDMSSHIKAGTRYKVSVNNDKTNKDAPYKTETDGTISDEIDSGENNEGTAGYYTNGYIRVIRIEKAGGNNNNNNPTPNP